MSDRWDSTNPSFSGKIKTWDEGYAFAMEKIKRDVTPVAAELYKAMMGDYFDADTASKLPDVLAMYGIAPDDDWFYG